MRFSLQALVDASGLTEAALARQVGLSGTTLKKVREVGLSESAADRSAVRVGFHPGEVWSEWGTAVASEVELARLEGRTVRRCVECSADFPALRRDQRFCSKRCRGLHSSREWKRRHPEMNRASRRAYYAEHGDYERARQRRYQQQRAAERRAA